MKKFFGVLALFSLTVTNVLPTFGQQPTPVPPTQDETIRVGTAAVQLDVIVSDKSGRRVRDLSAAEFDVRDENEPRSIDYFVAIDGSRVVSKTDRTAANADAKGNVDANATVPLTTPYQGRHIALVFDDLNLSNDNFLRSRRALSDFINGKLTRNDMAAIISTGGALGSLQQFTNDKQRLLSALNRIAAQGSSDRSPALRMNITPAEAARIDANDETVLSAVVRRVSNESLANQIGSTPSTAADLGGAGARNAEEEILRQKIRAEARAIIARSGASTRNVLTTLKNLFSAMANLPGRKIVVLLTESLSTLGQTTDDVTTQLTQLIDQARRSGVSVYSLDAAGLRTRNTTASEYITATGMTTRGTAPESISSDFENLGAARALAVATGGQLFANTNDIGAGLERAVEDSSSYYVIGFKPTALDNKFHRVAVSVKGRTDLIVRTRRGYLAINQETVRGTEAELLDALMRSPVPRIDLPLEVVANVVPVRGEQVVLMGLHVGRNYLTLPAANAADQTVNYEVVSYVFPAGHDKPVGALIRTASFDFVKEPQARQKLKTDGLILVKEFTQLPPGNYQIRAVVREKATGAVGSNYQFFEVPDLKQSKLTAVSSLVLTPVGQTGFSGHHSFKRGTEVEMRYVIYNLPNDHATLTQHVKLLDAEGRVMMDGPLPLSTTKVADNQSLYPQGTRVTVPAARGRYVLIVTLRDAKGKIDIERRADFMVE